MDEHIQRQLSLLAELIKFYRHGEITLNALLQRIEGISGVICSDVWNESVHQIVLDMEQINAALLEWKTQLSDADKLIIKKSLEDLESLIEKFSSDYKN